MNTHIQRMDNLINFTRNNSLIEPYGCSIYDAEDNCLVSTIGDKNSPINHAEILAINECSKLDDIKWDNLTLYTTGEPCCMCASACCWANIEEIIYATDIPFMSSLWNIESSLRAIDIIKQHPKRPNLIGGICKDGSNQLFIDRKEPFAEACRTNRWI